MEGRIHKTKGWKTGSARYFDSPDSHTRRSPMRPLSRHWLVQRFSLSPSFRYDKRVIQRAKDAIKHLGDPTFALQLS